MAGVSFADFPPHGSHIKGIPTQLFEAIVAAIDGYLYLYGLVPKGSYNVRSVNTNDSETFHSCIQSLSNSAHGVLNCKELERIMAKLINVMHMRLDPEKLFSIRTAKNPVYVVHESAQDLDESQSQPTNEAHHDNADLIALNVTDSMPHESAQGLQKYQSQPTHLHMGHDSADSTPLSVTDNVQPPLIDRSELKNHFFDSNERTRAKLRHKPKGVSDWLRPARGVQGFRSHYRVDESKLSTLARMGHPDNIESHEQ